MMNLIVSIFHSYKRLVPIISIGTFALLTTSCFTGIESTKKIELPKEKESITLMAEDTILNSVVSEPIGKWNIGKDFIISDDRAADVFETLVPEKLTRGKTIYYSGISAKKSPDGSDFMILEFSDGDNNLFSYNTRKSFSDTIFSDRIPMTIDAGMIRQTSEILKGRKLWTLTSLWYDTDGNTVAGRKFVPVIITDIIAGNMVFPCMAVFTDEKAHTSAQYLNIGSGGIGSRTFSSIFSLSDPRLRYPEIYDDIWELIQNGKVKTGMSKEECRLSLGSPSSINSGHDYSKTIDFWQYSDGTYLKFEDGLLVEFRL